MNKEKLGTGALKSKQDKRTIQHSDIAFAGVPLVKGGYEYLPQDIEHQHSVGICTAISLVQNREKANGKKYSPEFQYLLQKKFMDGGFNYEGSSVLSALKVAKNYGLLPIEKFTDLNGIPYITEQDRYLSYNKYITKLQVISDSEIQRLILLCVDKIPGYARVNEKDPQAIAKAIIESEAGVLCRFGCQDYWWIPSWAPKDIDPLRWKPETSGHAVGLHAFDFTETLKFKLNNTWGILWDWQGIANIIHSTYPPTEVWTTLKINPMFQFTKTLKFGIRDPEVKELQKRLNMYSWNQTGFFGVLTKSAVIKYQKSKGLVPDGICGPKTLAVLNQ